MRVKAVESRRRQGRRAWLRGRRSNRKLDDETQRTTLEILSRKEWMIAGKLWRARRRGVEKIHQ
jgi:hypothetical protein